MNGQLNSYDERPPTLVANGQKLLGERPKIYRRTATNFGGERSKIYRRTATNFEGERPQTLEANGHPYKIIFLSDKMSSEDGEWFVEVGTTLI